MGRRDCGFVICQMLNKIPEEEIELNKALRWNLNDAQYKAPEETIQWHRTQETLEKYISIPVKDWEFKVLSIFTEKSEDFLRAIDFNK